MNDLTWHDVTGTHAQIEMPDDWAADLPEGVTILEQHQPVLLEHADGGACALIQMLLSDGTIMRAVAWRGGRRFLRLRPDTGFTIEERHEGRVPRRHQRVVEETWRGVIEGVAHARRRIREAIEAAG